MKKVLLVAYFFPPIAATGSMRPLNFCRHLLALGWAPSVLATDAASVYPPQPADVKLLDRVPADVPVFRIRHSNPRTALIQLRERVGQWFSKRSSIPPSTVPAAPVSSDSASGQQKGGLRSFLRAACEAALEFPDPQYRWFRPAVRAMGRMPRAQRPDVIWATGGPWTNLLVGRRLSRLWGIPFIADFRDPWVGGHGHYASAFLRRQEERLERSVCAAAAKVVLNTDELRERFVQAYPEYREKFIALTNGYAVELEEFYAGLHAQEGSLVKNRQTGSPLEICHFGTVYGNRSPVALFQAVEELAVERSVDASQIRLRFVGAWDVPDSTCEQYAKRLEERGILKREPPVPHQQCLKEMGQADVLLILQQNYPLQIPAKIYEYIVAGRPLLILGGDGATANLVQRHRLGHCCPNAVSDIKAAVQSMVSGGAQLSAPAAADTAQFSYRVLSARLADLLTVVSEKPFR